jgi:hypothetical protein
VEEWSEGKGMMLEQRCAWRCDSPYINSTQNKCVKYSLYVYVLECWQQCASSLLQGRVQRLGSDRAASPTAIAVAPRCSVLVSAALFRDKT